MALKYQIVAFDAIVRHIASLNFGRLEVDSGRPTRLSIGRSDQVLPLVDESRLELPYEFALPVYEQIPADTVGHTVPAFGWKAKA